MEHTRSDESRAISVKKIVVASTIWMAFTTLVVLVPSISPWIVTPAVLVGIIFILGLLLLINIGIRAEKISETALYSIGLGLSAVMLGGAIINWYFPFLGITQPLAQLPLILFFDACVFILSFRAFFFCNYYKLSFQLKRPNLNSLILGIFPFVFLVMSVIGSSILNNGGNGIVTLIMLFLIALYVIILVYRRRYVQEWVYYSALYLIGLSLLLMYSLRSAHILGWDINQEYQVFQTTLQNLIWKMSYYPGQDYNACLSITILPTIFKELTHISSEYVFKVTFQLLFALTPLMIFVLARRYLNGILAFLASFLLLSQTWFFEQMPALIRQETAFIFYILILLVMFDKRISRSSRSILFYIFTVALILSHYSTAYTWLTLMFGTLLLSYVCRLFIPSLRKQPMKIKPLMLILSIAILFIWEVSLTHTGNGVVKLAKHTDPTLSTTTSQMYVNAITPSSSASTSVISGISAPKSTQAGIQDDIQKSIRTIFFATNNPNTDENIQNAEVYTLTIFGKNIMNKLYPNAYASGYVAHAVNDKAFADPKIPEFFSSIINFLTLASKLLFIDLFPIIGLIVMYRKMRKKSSEEGLDFVLLNLGAYILIVLMIFIPFLQVYYNFSRLYLQMFFTLSILSVIGGMRAIKYIPRYQTVIVAFFIIVIFCSLSGAFDQVTGGQKRITLAQPPGTSDTLFVHDTEIASAEWLSANRKPEDKVQADIIADLRLHSFGDMEASNNHIFPPTIERSSLIYLMDLNVSKQKAFLDYHNNILEYNYPLDFIDGNKDLIYSNGGSRIYR